MKKSKKIVSSPVGKLTLIATDTHLTEVLWEGQPSRESAEQKFQTNPDHPILSLAALQLAEYFLGKRLKFELPIKTDSGTEFQNRVWRALRSIPYGRTKSYAEIAQQIHSPKACRAVGAANGRNPLSIVVPCHRVIGANGTLTGFAGGLRTKQFLLEFERFRSL